MNRKQLTAFRSRRRPSPASGSHALLEPPHTLAQLTQLLALGAGQAIVALASVELDLLDPVAQRLLRSAAVPRSRPQRLTESKRRLEEEFDVECRANAAYEAYRACGRMKDGRRFGRPPDPDEPPKRPGSTSPTRTRATSRPPAAGCWATTVQAAVTEQQIVTAAEVTVDSPDFGHLEPIVTATETELSKVGITTVPDVVLADAGYWHQV